MLFAEFTSLEAVEWRIEIHGTAVSREFKLTDGFRLSLEGQNQKKYTPLLPSSVRFSFLVDQFNEAFLAELVDATEEQHQVVIYRNLTFYWAGFIVTDVVGFEDMPHDYVASITAIDGLTRLQKIDYKNDAGQPYTGRQTLTTTILQALKRVNLSQYFDTTYLRVIVNWFESNHLANTNPFDQTDVDARIFLKIDKNGNKSYKSCWQVLEAICTAFAARLMFSEGAYRLYQINEFENTTQTEYQYDTNGTNLLTSTVDYNLLIQRETANRIRSTLFHEFYAPLKQVRVIYDHITTDNKLQGVTWDYNNSPVVTITENIEVPFGSFVTMQFSGRVEMQSFFTTAHIIANGYPYHRFEFALSIEIGGTTNLVRNANTVLFYLVNYEDAQWSVQDGEFIIYSEVITDDNASLTNFLNINFETPRLYNSGAVTVRFYLKRIFDEAGNEYVHEGFSGNILTWWLNNPVLQLKEGERGNIIEYGPIVYNAFNDANNSEKHEVRIIIGDGPEDNSISRLKNTTTLENTTTWQVGGTGDALPIGRLLAQEIAGGHAKAIQKINGTLISKNIQFHSRLELHNIFYIMIGVEFDAHTEEWTGEWFAVDYDATAVDTSADDIITDDTIIADPGSGGIIIIKDLPTDTSNNDETGLAASVHTYHLQEQSVSKVDTYQLAGSTATSLNITAVATEFIQPGGKIKIVNPVSGYNETLTFSSSNRYEPGSKSFPIEQHTFQKAFPHGSYLIIDEGTVAENSDSGGKFNLPEVLIGQSGVTTAITKFNLPDPSTVTVDEIHRRLKLWRNGVLQIYTHNFTLDTVGINNNIIWTLALDAETVRAELTP